jgi:hypothetical protein
MSNDDDHDDDDDDGMDSAFLDAANEKADWEECSKMRQQVATVDFFVNRIAIVVAVLFRLFE